MGGFITEEAGKGVAKASLVHEIGFALQQRSAVMMAMASTAGETWRGPLAVALCHIIVILPASTVQARRAMSACLPGPARTHSKRMHARSLAICSLRCRSRQGLQQS